MLSRAVVVERGGDSPARTNAAADASWYGGWAPQESAAVNPPFSSIDRAAAACAGSPACDAQDRAISSRVRAKARSPPASKNGSAWKGLAAERQ